MTKNGPGKSYRRGITLLEVTERFNIVEKAEAWFIEQRWRERDSLPALRRPQHRYRYESKADALPVSRMPQALLG